MGTDNTTSDRIDLIFMVRGVHGRVFYASVSEKILGQTLEGDSDDGIVPIKIEPNPFLGDDSPTMNHTTQIFDLLANFTGQEFGDLFVNSFTPGAQDRLMTIAENESVIERMQAMRGMETVKDINSIQPNPRVEPDTAIFLVETNPDFTTISIHRQMVIKKDDGYYTEWGMKINPLSIIPDDMIDKLRDIAIQRIKQA